MRLSGWGNRPNHESLLYTPSSYSTIQRQVTSNDGIIGRGLGRSYGDSALATKACLSTNHLDHFIAFDEHSGTIQCQSGVSLDEILKVIVPKGWFLPVTPGTKFVTVGGAIASDVHGKNHHLNGCFSEHVRWIDIVIADGSIKRVSRNDYGDLFRATCGGMGLTGVILAAEIELIKISSTSINQTTIKTSNLKHTLDIFEQTKDATYSVAWIDCLASGSKKGRCVLTLGEHASVGDLTTHTDGKMSVPFNFPTFALNSMSVSLFNKLYYGKVLYKESHQVVHYDPYFYPLDGLNNWNRIYGKHGFIQYQFVVPYESGYEALEKALSAMSKSGMASFLAVLKHLGPQNQNYLSFPMEGYTLAVDFKWSSNLTRLVGYLDSLVREHGGRIYLTKDSMMDESIFNDTYHRVGEFTQVRKKYGADKVFNSLQSQRLGL